MNTTKVNAVIGFTIVVAAGLALFLQGDSSVLLNDDSMALVAGFAFLSILSGMIYWRRNMRQETSFRRRRTATKKR